MSKIKRQKLWIIIVLSVFALGMLGCDDVKITTTTTPSDPNSTASSSSTSATTSTGTSTGTSTSSSSSTPVIGLDGELIPSSNQTASSTDSSTPASKVTQGTVKVNTWLNVRSGPWGTILGSLRNDEKIEIVAKEGDWYKINYNGKTAYVHGNYIETEGKPASQIAPTPPSTNTPTTPPTTSNPPSTDGRFGGPPASPIPTRVSSEYGPRSLFGRSFHSGIDLPMPTGTSLKSIGDGVVVAVSYESAGGKYVKIRYGNGYEAVYCHLQKATVSVGQRVSQGQEIAKSDNTGQSTGPHLHLGIRKNGQFVNPRSVPGLVLPPKR